MSNYATDPSLELIVRKNNAFKMGSNLEIYV